MAHINEANIPPTPHAVVHVVRNLLNTSSDTPWTALPDSWKHVEGMEELYCELYALRDLCSSLAQGRLQYSCSTHGYIIATLKEFQDRLRGIATDAQRIAAGGLSQELDFFDDFSSSLNTMLQQIHGVLTELQATSEQYKNMARVDTLTGALNRRGFEEEVLREMERARRAKSSLAILAADLDYFKKINDTYGHAAGDAVLCAFVSCLHTTLRETDRVGRLGGEEFSILLPEATSESMGLVAERIRAAVENLTIQYGGNVIRITASFGFIATSWENIVDVNDRKMLFKSLLECSDIALYQSKKNGRNVVTEYTDSQA